MKRVPPAPLKEFQILHSADRVAVAAAPAPSLFTALSLSVAMSRSAKGPDDQVKLKKILDELTKREENKFCADCGCRGTRFNGKISRSRGPHGALLLPRRTAMGVHQPGRIHLHRVLGHPPQPGRAPHVRAQCEPGLVDGRASGGAFLYRRCIYVARTLIRRSSCAY